MNIYEYLNYRDFLKSFYEYKKESSSSFSYQAFSLRAGLKSPAHLRLVINGERNLSEKTLEKFCTGLGLKGKEKTYFESLVKFNQEEDTELKAKLFLKLNKIRGVKNQNQMNDKEQSTLFLNWYYPILFELAQMDDFKLCENWIHQKIGQIVSKKDISKAIEVLISKGLLIKKEGRLLPYEGVLKSDDEVVNLLVRAFQKKMIRISLEKFEGPLDNREMGSLTVSCSQDSFKALKSRLKDLIREFNEDLSSDQHKTELVQLNFQLFKFS